MNRSDFQALADIRANEAQALLNAGHFAGAYYLAGYAVECALKAYMAGLTKEFDFPDKSLVNQMYTHDLEKLIGLASLQPTLTSDMASDADFARRWALVKDWSEDARYERHDATAARELVSATVDNKSGVLRWLKLHW